MKVFPRTPKELLFSCYCEKVIHFFSLTQIDKEQYDKVLRYIDMGKREGATLLTGGTSLSEQGYYIEPTIFTDVKV